MKTGYKGLQLGALTRPRFFDVSNEIENCWEYVALWRAWDCADRRKYL